MQLPLYPLIRFYFRSTCTRNLKIQRVKPGSENISQKFLTPVFAVPGTCVNLTLSLGFFAPQLHRSALATILYVFLTQTTPTH